MAVVIAWQDPSLRPEVFQARGDPFRHLRDAIDDGASGLTFWRFCFGGLLSLALFYIVGSAFYFSAASYATVAGRCRSSVDLADLGSSGKHHWRAVCGLSASFLFAVVSRLVDREVRASDHCHHSRGRHTPGTRVRGGEPRDAAGRPYPSVRIVSRADFGSWFTDSSRLVESRPKGTDYASTGKSTLTTKRSP